MTLPETPALLQAARDLIADPRRWTRQVYARDVEGQEIAPTSQWAVCWCGLGALYQVCGGRTDTATLLRDYLNLIVKEAVKANVNYMHIDIVTVNDNYMRADVLSVYDNAISGYEQWRATQ